MPVDVKAETLRHEPALSADQNDAARKAGITEAEVDAFEQQWRIVTACYHTQLPWSDEEEGLHEAEYAPEGWYEESDSSETIYRTSSPPTHWRHLPAPPSPGVQHD